MTTIDLTSENFDQTIASNEIGLLDSWASTVRRNLGACRPALAHQALLADPSIAALLPCSVAVRSIDPETTAVEAFGPAFMVVLVGGEAVRAVAADAGDRLTNMFETLSKED